MVVDFGVTTEERLEKAEGLLGQALARIEKLEQGHKTHLDTSRQWSNRIDDDLAKAERRILELERGNHQRPSNCPGEGYCSYQSYLAWGKPGSPNLTHEAFHAAEEECRLAQDRYERHVESCETCQKGRFCSMEKQYEGRSQYWERKVRA